MKRSLLITAILMLALLAGCSFPQIMDGDGMVNSYKQIDQETAKQMMERDDGHVIVDVRREDEYAAGHIPGAILIPNESIGTEKPSQLPDLRQIILIYCRSGNRSRQAAQKLFDMGYTNVYEFGGIITWTGEIVAEEETEMNNSPAVLSFDSFEGGGPEYTVELDDPSLVSVTENRTDPADGREEIDGGGYSVAFTFEGRKEGETKARITSVSPIAGNEVFLYLLTVDARLNVTARFLAQEDTDTFIKPTPMLVIEAGGKQFYAVLEDNSSAEAFIEKLNSAAVEVEMHDYGGFEMVGPLPWQLPANDERITTQPGDVILYQGEQITVYYAQNTWSFTRLARIWNVTKEELMEAFGDGNVTVSFRLEWSE